MVWWLPVSLLALYFLCAVTFTRARAEAGLPWGNRPGMTPHGFLTDVVGKTHYSLPSLVMLSYMQWFDLDYRCMAMPNQLEAMKIGDSTTGPGRMNPRQLFVVIMWATFDRHLILLVGGPVDLLHPRRGDRERQLLAYQHGFHPFSDALGLD